MKIAAIPFTSQPASRNASTAFKLLPPVEIKSSITTTDNFKKAKCKLITLSNYDTMIAQALQSNYITDKDLKSLQAWRENPAEWGK